MGIRFLCPNGHRLNVKAFLAGKRGVCPHCAAKMMIPLESQLEPRSKSSSVKSQPVESGGAATAARTSVSDRTAPASSVNKTSSEQPTAAPATKDPIKESPDMVWYVRPKGGGQYGPARGEVMNRWITEGRVAADSLIWREGWDDWQVASETLPQLASSDSPRSSTDSPRPSTGPQPAKTASARPKAKAVKAKDPVVPEAPVAKATPSADGEKPVPAATTTGRRRKRRKANPKAITAVIVLSLVSIGLLVALVIVLMQRGSA